MAVGSSSLLVNNMTAIVLIVLGFLILASGYRYGLPSSLIGGSFVLILGIVLMILKIVRRNRSRSSG